MPAPTRTIDTTCPTCGRHRRHIADEVDECRDPKNRNERRCLVVQLAAEQRAALPPAPSPAPSPPPAPHGEVRLPAPAPVPAPPPQVAPPPEVVLPPQIAELQRLIDSLKQQLGAEQSRHIDTQIAAEHHKSWADQLLAEVGALKHKIDQSQPSIHVPVVPVAWWGRLWAATRPLLVGAGMKTGGIAAVVGAVLGAGGLHWYGEGAPAAQGPVGAASVPAAVNASVPASAPPAHVGPASSIAPPASAVVAADPLKPMPPPPGTGIAVAHPADGSATTVSPRKLAGGGPASTPRRATALNVDSGSGATVDKPASPAQRDLQAECTVGTHVLDRTLRVYLCMRKNCQKPELAAQSQCKSFCAQEPSAC